MSRRVRERRRRARRRWLSATAALVVLGLGAGAALVSCGGGSSAAPERRRTTATTIPPTTTTVFVPTAPLTGLPDPSGVSQTRSALSVKIENTPDARPQAGLDVADVVYEEMVEGGITRFWAVFSSAAPGRVGPIRSVRLMDPNVVWPIGGVIAYSGGTDENVRLIRETPTVWIDENNAADAFSRDPKRYAPHNLFGDPAKLWARGGEPVPPRPLFTYLGKGETFAGEGIDSFRVGFQAGYDPTYTFDPATRTWKRSYGAVAFTDESGAQVAPTNVIVQFVSYPRGAEGELLGEGEAWVFSDHQLVRGRWVKPNPETPTQFVDAAGLPIRLTPGRTWVELLPTGSPVDLVAAPLPPPTVPPTTPPTKPPTTTKKQR
ncbi:MAG: hypothetical protein AMXMBFR46_07910 [Acidimicrobiia bacterium]